ncbi:MAG: hypothetical protein ACWA5K_00165 [bacterium]
MFTNKHVIAALIITPILAVLGYFAVDSLVSEKPHKAVEGQSYQLVAKPNCRYASGACQMKNQDFEIRITLNQKADQLVLSLESEFPLDGGKVSLDKDQGGASLPATLVQTDSEGKAWEAKYFMPYTGAEWMRVVLSASGALYYGETVAAFANYESAYGEDFRTDR